MLLFAVLETWIVTIWQPEVGRHDLEVAVAKFFAFPLVVQCRILRPVWLEGPVHLVIVINYDSFNLFILESPEVTIGTPSMVFWFTRTRLIAFQILFRFHLIVLLLLLLILGSVDVTYRLFQIRAINKNSKGDLEGFSRSFEEGRTRWSDSSTSHRERSFSIEA